MKTLHFAFVALSLAIALCAFAAPTAVTYDENGDISPAAAKVVISNACSAVVAVDLANARAERLTEVAEIASGTMVEANALLNSHSDYVLLDMFAVGVEDALASGSQSASAGEIRITDVRVSRPSSSQTDVTISWQYVAGSFSAPKIIASSSVTNGSLYAEVPMSDPIMTGAGTNVTYEATAYIDNATFGSSAFFKIEATPDAPLDDGQVFDIFSDGTDYTFYFVPTNRYAIRVISGRITSITLQNP